MKILMLLVLAVAGSFGGFVIHVLTVEWLPEWIGTQMQGIQLQPSWNVKYLAAFTSIEYSLSTMFIYVLARNKLLKLGQFKSACVISLILLTINALLIRQPLMDFAIGNPIDVVLVQNAFKWMPWILMAFIIVYGYELIQKATVTKSPSNNHQSMD
ncbi:MAG: hypothetical protein KDI92_11225 [Xanthomonadales bacterium]|nr:hypothetical protein [Xanthomonadales bacterium]